MDEQIIIEELRECSDRDADSIRDLVRQLDTSFQPLSDEDIRKMIEATSTHLYVVRAHDSQKIIGMITLIVYRIPYKMKGWLEDVVVDENYRGRGIATKLLQHAIDRSKEFGVKSLNLTSNPKRENANKLYLKLGFEKRETNVYRISF